MKIILIITAIILCLCVNYFIIPWAFNDMKTYISKKNKYKSNDISVNITTGICQFTTSAVMNTSDEDKKNFIHFPKSINKPTGAQFSYTYWLKLGTSDLSNKIFFMKGDFNKRSDGNDLEKLAKLKTSDQKNIYCTQSSDCDNLIKCPLVKFTGKTGESTQIQHFQIEFNTLKEPHNIIHINEDVTDLLKSSSKNPRWYLISITFQDNYLDDSDPGVFVQIYLNSSLIKQHFVPNDSLLINDGNFYLLPGSTISDSSESFFADLKYHNYALSHDQIVSLFEDGYRNDVCAITSDTKIQQQFQKLNFYNELKQT